MRYIGKRTTAITCRVAVVQANQLHVYSNDGTVYPNMLMQMPAGNVR